MIHTSRVIRRLSVELGENPVEVETTWAERNQNNCLLMTLKKIYILLFRFTNLTELNIKYRYGGECFGKTLEINERFHNILISARILSIYMYIIYCTVYTVVYNILYIL